MKKCEITAREGGYAKNAGAAFYYLIGGEHFFSYSYTDQEVVQTFVNQLINPGSVAHHSIKRHKTHYFGASIGELVLRLSGYFPCNRKLRVSPCW